jgi:hypothetical protein
MMFRRLSYLFAASPLFLSGVLLVLAAAADQDTTTLIQNQMSPAQVFNTISRHGLTKDAHQHFSRHLEITEQCLAELNALSAVPSLPDPTEEQIGEACEVTDTYLDCDVAEFGINDSVVSACTAAGGQNIEVTLTFGASPVSNPLQIITSRFSNFAFCIGASCDADEVIDLAQSDLRDALSTNLASEGFKVDFLNMDVQTSSSSMTKVAFLSALATAGVLLFTV